MHVLNHILNPFFQALFYPVQGSSQAWAIAWISLVTALLALAIYRFLSTQQSIRRTKEQLKAHILEMRLFQHDPVLMWRAMRSLFISNLNYLRLNVKPFLIMFVPVLLILVQTEARLGHRPLHPGESVLVKTFWKEGTTVTALPEDLLSVSDGLSIVSPALRMADNREIDWKVRAVREGTSHLSMRAAAQVAAIPVYVSNRMVPLSTWNGRADSLDMLLHPAAHPLPSPGELVSVEILYPVRNLTVRGHVVHWIWAFLTLTLLFGYLLKGVFGVYL